MCLVCSMTFDQTRADAFSQKLLGHLNGAAIMLMTSLGHRTGLFDAMGDDGWYTSHTLAEKAELSERYVREWLGAMTTGGIVEYDPSTKRYHLPAEHASFLTRKASPNNLAATAQWIAVLGGVEDEVAEAFRHGKGVPYSAYGRFHEVMAEESAQTTVAGLNEHIIPYVRDLEQKLDEGIDVADIGCGRGRALIHMAKRYPRSRFVGLDLSGEALDSARQTAESARLSNIRFVQTDLTRWSANRAFDLITAFDAIHDQSRPDLVLQNIRRALRPDGVFLMQDIKASSHVEKNLNGPLAPFTYTVSCMHCMSVSLAQGGMGLGAAWGVEKAQQMLNEAGFNHVRVSELPHDIINYYYECRA